MDKEVRGRKIFLVLLISVVVIGIILDAANRWLSVYSELSEDGNFSIFFRALVFVVAFPIAAYYHRWFLWLSAAFGIAVFVGSLSVIDSVEIDWLLKIKYLVKFLFIPSVFLAIDVFVRRYGSFAGTFIWLMRYVFVSQALITFVGAALGADFFNSYSNRFGFSPLIASINEASLFYIVGISLMYYDFVYKITSGQIVRLGSLIIVLVGGVVLGTKAVYLFVLLLLGYHIFRSKEKRVFAVGAILGVIVLVSVLIVPFFVRIYHDAGLLNSISSMRYELILKKVAPLLSDQWSWYNYLVGGNNTWQHFVEIDFLDLFTFSGLIGLVIVLYIWFNSVFCFGRNNSFGLFVALSIMAISNMSGHFLWSGVNAIYLSLMCIAIRQGWEASGNSPQSSCSLAHPAY